MHWTLAGSSPAPMLETGVCSFCFGEEGPGGEGRDCSLVFIVVLGVFRHGTSQDQPLSKALPVAKASVPHTVCTLETRPQHVSCRDTIQGTFTKDCLFSPL